MLTTLHHNSAGVLCLHDFQAIRVGYSILKTTEFSRCNYPQPQTPAQRMSEVTPSHIVVSFFTWYPPFFWRTAPHVPDSSLELVRYLLVKQHTSYFKKYVDLAHNPLMWSQSSNFSFIYKINFLSYICTKFLKYCFKFDVHLHQITKGTINRTLRTVSIVLVR